MAWHRSFTSLFLRTARKAALAFAPKSRRLPIKYFFCKLNGGDKELINLNKIGPNEGIALDVGANIGLFSYRLSQLYEKVYAFEVNTELSRDLTDYKASNVVIVNKGLSSSASQLKLFIPIVNGRLLTGWASLAPGNCPDTDQHLEKIVEVIALDSMGLENVRFIKIDVEGHELEVLKGAQIGRAHV